MPSIGLGVTEIRIHTRVEHRVFYKAKFREAIYVLHAFQKATRKTDKADIDLAKRRLGQLIRERRMQRELQGRKVLHEDETHPLKRKRFP
jgi:phage-related protein